MLTPHGAHGRRRRSVAVAALVAATLRGSVALAADALPTARGSVELVWVAPSGRCPVDPPSVVGEARRLFRWTSLSLAWRLAPASDEAAPSEISVVVLRSDPARRAHPPLGATMRASYVTTWIMCSEIARTINAPDVPSASLNTAMGRVLAHELVHALAPGIPHAPYGLMAAKVDAAILTQPTLEMDSRLLRAVRAELLSRTAAGPVLLADPALLAAGSTAYLREETAGAFSGRGQGRPKSP